jgi:hypothetical protein
MTSLIFFKKYEQQKDGFIPQKLLISPCFFMKQINYKSVARVYWIIYISGKLQPFQKHLLKFWILCLFKVISFSASHNISPALEINW